MEQPSTGDQVNNKTEINTSGGAVFDGSFTVKGDLIGRDKNIHIAADQSYDVGGLPSPYLGLNPYTYNERGKYAGRDREIAEAVRELTQPDAQRTLFFITGASGSGKSSFAQAGLLPALEAHYAERSKTLVRLPIVRPGPNPAAQLKDALGPLGIASLADLAQPRTGTPAVLVLDQFEEFFTQSPPDQRAATFEQLAQLPPFARSQLHIIATLRSDYLNELFDQQALWEVAKRGLELRQMSEVALQAAIQRPLRAQAERDAAYAEKRFEPSLLEKLAQQASSEPSLLPLLQVTLDELWRKRKRLTLSSYAVEKDGEFVRDGELTDAIQRRADDVLTFADYDEAQPAKKRTEAERDTVLATLLDLVAVSLDDKNQRDVRISRRMDALAPERRKLAEDLAHARLLSITAHHAEVVIVQPTTIEVVNIIHESLISNWHVLSERENAQRAQLQRRARFEQDLRDWLANEKSNDYLLKDMALGRARELDRANDIALNDDPNARELFRRSTEASEAEQQRRIREAEERVAFERRSARRTRIFSAGLAVLLVASLIASGLAVRSGQEAERQRQVAVTSANDPTQYYRDPTRGRKCRAAEGAEPAKNSRGGARPRQSASANLEVSRLGRASPQQSKPRARSQPAAQHRVVSRDAHARGSLQHSGNAATQPAPQSIPSEAHRRSAERRLQPQR